MSVDRVFLDANILFSAAYGSPGLARLWEFAGEGHCELFASNYVVEEARRNLSDPEQLRKLGSCLLQVKVISDVDPEIPCPIELPEKDRPVLLAANSIKANYLLTGDAIHFGKYFGKTVRSVRICRPGDYFGGPEFKKKRKRA